jgi:hypothetical protein
MITASTRKADIIGAGVAVVTV